MSYWNRACRLGLEGIVSRRRDAVSHNRQMRPAAVGSRLRTADVRDGDRRGKAPTSVQGYRKNGQSVFRSAVDKGETENNYAFGDTSALSNAIMVNDVRRFYRHWE